MEGGITVALICPIHGFKRGSSCDECHKVDRVQLPGINTEEWVKGEWEHIDKEPIKIDSFEHLKAECNKRGVIPKAFCKPKSTGKGWEWSK